MFHSFFFERKNDKVLIFNTVHFPERLPLISATPISISDAISLSGNIILKSSPKSFILLCNICKITYLMASSTSALQAAVGMIDFDTIFCLFNAACC